MAKTLAETVHVGNDALPTKIFVGGTEEKDIDSDYLGLIGDHCWAKDEDTAKSEEKTTKKSSADK